MAAEIKIVVVDDSPAQQAAPPPGAPGGPAPPNPPRNPAGRRRPANPPPPAPGGGGNPPPPPGEPTEAERRRSYGFRVRNRVNANRQAEAEKRQQYQFRVREGVNAARQAERERRQQYAFRVKEGMRKKREAQAERRRKDAEAKAQARQAQAEQRRKDAEAKAQARQAEAEKRQQYAFRVKEGMRKKRQAEAEKRRKQQIARQAESARQQRNAQYATLAVTAANARGPGRFASIGGAGGAVLGAAVGGPVGAIAGQAIGEKIGGKIDDPAPEATAALKFLGRAAEVAGQGMVRVAGNDGIGALQVGANAVSEVFEEIPLGGKTVAAGFKALSQTLGAAQQVVGAFTQRARELQGYNGSIAAAAANQDVTRILGDIREAQMLGDKYASALDAQTRFEETLRSGLLPLKEWLLERLPSWLDAVLDVLIAMLRALDRSLPGKTVFEKMADEAEKTKRLLEAGREGILPPIDEWVKAAAGMALPGLDGGPRDPLAPLRLPIIRAAGD